MATTGKSAAATVSAAGRAAAVSASFAGVNASFTGGDTLAVDSLDILGTAGSDTLAVDLGAGISFIGKTAAEAL